MIIVRTVEGSSPIEYSFDVRKIPLSRATMLETRYQKLTGDTSATIEQLRLGAIQGGAAALRVALWHVEELQHVGRRIEDVDPLVGEVTVKPTLDEIEEIREGVKLNTALSDSQRELMFGGLDAMAAEARSEGKAPSTNSTDATG